VVGGDGGLNAMIRYKHWEKQRFFEKEGRMNDIISFLF